MSKVISVLALGLVAACGPMNGGAPVLGVLKGVAAQANGTAPVQADPRRDLTREMIEASPSELILVSILARDSAATLIRAGENGDTITWISPDGISVSFERGILKASRGLGFDLFGANVADIRRALDAGGGEATREMDIPAEEGQIYNALFNCKITRISRNRIEIIGKTHETTQFEEFCSGIIGEFTNIYFLDGSGQVVQSRQWVSPGIGYLEMNLL